MRGYIDQISDDWKGPSSKNGHHRPSSSTNDASQIKLVLVDDANEDERHSFDVGSSTTLKDCLMTTPIIVAFLLDYFDIHMPARLYS
ncbi:hypothetical protein ACHAXR_000405 [Thalassiosira sp. AJA248-18]